MLKKNSIQAGLGGIGLIPTIIQPDESITHLSNLIAVQINETHTPNVNDFRIVTLPINTFGDGGVHLAFDFAHWVGFVWFLLILQGHRPARGGRCATLSTGTLKPPVVEVSISEDLTIDQLKHTKLIGHYITLRVDSVVVDVCLGSIIAAEV